MADFEQVAQEEVDRMVGALPPAREDDEFADADEYVALAEQRVKEEARRDAAAIVPYDPRAMAPSAQPVSVFNPAKFIVGKGDATYKNRTQLRRIGCDWIGDKWIAPSELQRIAAISMCQTFPEGAPDGAVVKLQQLFGIVEQQRGLAGPPPSFKPFDTIPDDLESVADIAVQIGQALGGQPTTMTIVSAVAQLGQKAAMNTPAFQKKGKLPAPGTPLDPSTAGQAMIPKPTPTPTPTPAAPVPQQGAPRVPKQRNRPVLATDLGDIKQGHLDAIKGIPTEALIYELRRRHAIEAPIETFGEAVEEQIEIPPDLDSAFEFDQVDIYGVT